MKSRTILVALLAAVVCLMISCAQTDTGITMKVKAKMAADSTVKASQIQVDTKNKVVTLTGDIDSQEAKNRALELARNTDGVVDVVDMIAVRTAGNAGDAPEPDRSVGEVIDDAGITMKVKAKLLSDDGVKGTRIDVDTREGVVYLTGKVNSEAEKNKAVQLAKETKGVKDVQVNLAIEKG